MYLQTRVTWNCSFEKQIFFVASNSIHFIFDFVIIVLLKFETIWNALIEPLRNENHYIESEFKLESGTFACKNPKSNSRLVVQSL